MRMPYEIISRSIRFFGRKTIKMALVVSAVCAFSFTLVSLSPINPVAAYIGADMMNIGPQQHKMIEKRWGLDRPAPERFIRWFGEIVRGNFGNSMIYNEPVMNVIGKRFLTSLSLMIIAWIFSGVIGFLLGVVSGAYSGTIIAKIIDLYSYILASAPVFWIGILLLILFSVQLGWTPLGGSIPPGVMPDDATIIQKMHHIILPALSLSIITIAHVTLHTKAKTEDLMRSDFVLYAKARGESVIGIIRHHILRNAALPALSVHFAAINEIFGGSVLVEQVFSYPGVGKAGVEAGIRGDIPLLLGIAIFSTIFVFWGNALADWIYTVVDPRMRQARRES